MSDREEILEQMRSKVETLIQSQYIPIPRDVDEDRVSEWYEEMLDILKGSHKV